MKTPDYIGPWVDLPKGGVLQGLLPGYHLRVSEDGAFVRVETYIDKIWEDIANAPPITPREEPRPSEEFWYGNAVGFVFGQTDQSSGVGLFYAWDLGEEGGGVLVVGPLSLWWRRWWPTTLAFLSKPLKVWRGRD